MSHKTLTASSYALYTLCAAFFTFGAATGETWLNAVRTDTSCRPGEVINGQYRGDSRHSGNYMSGGNR